MTMTQTLPDLALGQPRFQNAALQAIADAQGPIEAWRTAVGPFDWSLLTFLIV